MKNKFNLNIDVDALKKNASAFSKVAADSISKAAAVASDASKVAVQKGTEVSKVAIQKGTEASKVAIQKGSEATEVIKQKSSATKDELIKTLDADGNGTFDINDVIIHSFKTPGVRIERSAFFRKEFSTFCTDEQLNLAIATNPANANIPMDLIDKVSNDIIQSERIKVSGISAALCAPGGIAMAATIPADIMQYYACTLRVAQELLYLYGFPEIDIHDNAPINSETMNMLTLTLGTMYGVAGAKNGIQVVANGLAKGVKNQLMKKALTKGTIYPIVKEVSKWFGVKMTKEVFTKSISNSIPVVGGAIGGGLTYATFKPCCVRLQNAIKETKLADPNIILSQQQEQEIIDVYVD